MQLYQQKKSLQLEPRLEADHFLFSTTCSRPLFNSFLYIIQNNVWFRTSSPHLGNDCIVGMAISHQHLQQILANG